MNPIVANLRATMKKTKPKIQRKRKLSRLASFLIEDFASDAKYHGWAEDRGTRSEPDDAKQNYEQSRAKLEAYVLKLQELAYGK